MHQAQLKRSTKFTAILRTKHCTKFAAICSTKFAVVCNSKLTLQASASQLMRPVPCRLDHHLLPRVLLLQCQLLCICYAKCAAISKYGTIFAAICACMCVEPKSQVQSRVGCQVTTRLWNHLLHQVHTAHLQCQVHDHFRDGKLLLSVGHHYSFRRLSGSPSYTTFHRTTIWWTRPSTAQSSSLTI